MKLYAVVCATGGILVGVLGFAFKEYFDLPAYILLIHLVIGIWGFTIIFQRSRHK
ncbi:MAG: hypothetical protein AAB948_01020 [Patescibacteria group bacterium]